MPVHGRRPTRIIKPLNLRILRVLVNAIHSSRRYLRYRRPRGSIMLGFSADLEEIFFDRRIR